MVNSNWKCSDFLFSLNVMHIHISPFQVWTLGDLEVEWRSLLIYGYVENKIECYVCFTIADLLWDNMLFFQFNFFTI